MLIFNIEPMNNEFKNAAARLIFDIIGADGYVSDRELNIMEAELNDKYNLIEVERVLQANSISFSGALEILQNYENKDEVDRLLDELYLIAGVGEQQYKNKAFSRLEGHCSLYEAWLLFAIEYAIREKAKVFSIQKKEYRFSRSEIIYIENGDSGYERFHAEMDSRFDEFKTRLELYGMRLVFIPKVCQYLKEKRKQGKLISLMRYVSPYKHYENADAENIASKLDKISTAEFVKDILPEREKSLYNKLKPSFLLKIKTTIVIKEKPIKVNDFIIIPIKDSVNNTLNEALEKYTHYTLDRHIPEWKLHGRPFILHGFDRTFLNFAMSHLLTSDRLTRVIFDFSRVVDGKKNKKQVTFDFDGKRQVSVDFENKPMVLFFLILIYTLYSNGLPVHEEAVKKRKRQLGHEKVFSALYKKVTENDTRLYNSKGILSSEITRLNKMIETIPEKYWPQKDDTILRIPYITKDMVYVKIRNEEFILFDKIEEIIDKQHKKDFESALADFFG